jgi:hypothetical protein
MPRFDLRHSALSAVLFLLVAFSVLAQDSPSSSPATETDAALAQAELLLAAARAGKLTEAEAEKASELLDHDDPFVAGIVEWAIATKVNNENDGQVERWPGSNPPAWFVRWSRLDGDFLLQSDYVRQAFVWGVHRDAAGLRGSAGLIVRRASGTLDDARARGISEASAAQLQMQLERLRTLRDQLAARIAQAPADLPGHRRLWLAARHTARTIVLANPTVKFDQLAFVQCHPASFPNITGSQYPWGQKPGGDICVQTGLHPGDPVRDLLQGRLGPGHVHGLDLRWDADRVVFGYARQPDWPPPWDTLSGDHVFPLRSDQEPTHLFEVRLDGSGLRQLTDHRYWSDFEPTYLPDGGIAFASDRSGRSSECGKFSADHTVINLYAVDADGGNLRRLNDNKDIDRYPHTLDNGLVGYTRWEYQERHFLEVHSFWTMRPDGTQADAVYKQHLPAPYGLRDTRSIPGTSRLVSIATGHHTLAYGPVVVIDPTRGINDPRGLRIVTPGVVPQEGKMAGEAVAEGGVRDAGGVYQTPWALSETCFLVSYSYSSSTRANGFALYVIDVFGNKELVHRDLIHSCSFPMPVRPRPRPPIVAQTADASQPTATCYVADIHRGLTGVAPGSVKYLRISQRVGWPLDDEVGAMRYIPGNAWEKQFGYWEWAPVRVWGVVPVQPDGSAHFVVPADASVYFQALDENGMELRRMRSHVTLQGGEVRGCVGCHESSAHAPALAATVGERRPASNMAAALASPPDSPTPPPWGADQLLGYERLIQPTLDQHCVRCHGVQQPDGGLDLSATRAPDGFLQSFRTMFGLPPDGLPTATGAPSKARLLVSVSNRFSGAAVTQPLEFGSHQSPLATVLLNDELHRREVQLTPDQWLTLVTWIDANAPYHDTFFNRRPRDGGPPARSVVWSGE